MNVQPITTLIEVMKERNSLESFEGLCYSLEHMPTHAQQDELGICSRIAKARAEAGRKAFGPCKWVIV